MQNTVQQTGDKQQGTPPGALADKIAGQRIVKQNFAHPVTENQKQNRKNKAKKQSVQDCFFYRSRNLRVVVCTVGFRDSRK